MELIHNLKDLKDKRRELRKNPTYEERIIWARLRGKQLGCRWHRQHSIGPYIVDFYCPTAKLILELDGNHHREKESENYDEERTVFFKNLGLKVLRVWNNEIHHNLNEVMVNINSYL